MQQARGHAGATGDPSRAREIERIITEGDIRSVRELGAGSGGRTHAAGFRRIVGHGQAFL